MFCFRFSFFVAFILFCFFCIFLLVVVLLRLCFLLYASNYSQNIFPYHCGVLFFLVSYFFVLMTSFSLYFYTFSILFFAVEGDALLRRRNLPFKSDQQYIC